MSIIRLFAIVWASALIQEEILAVFYDFKTGDIKTECLREGWQTGSSMKVVRLAFNLYCNTTPSVDDYKEPEEQMDECMKYTVEDLFCCTYAPFFWQAIQIRCPDYANYNCEI